MKRKIHFLLAVTFLGLFFMVFSCTKKGSEMIDQKYVNSRAYINFMQKSATEIQQNATRNKPLLQLFETSFRCKNIPQLILPAIINLKKVNTLQKKIPEKCTYQIGTDSRKISVKIIGESLFNDKIIRWILLDSSELYTEQELLLAVFKKRDIMSLKKIATFQKNITNKVTSKIIVKKQKNGIKISVTANLKILYPIEQLNASTSLYEITEKGEILRR